MTRISTDPLRFCAFAFLSMRAALPRMKETQRRKDAKGFFSGKGNRGRGRPARGASLPAYLTRRHEDTKKYREGFLRAFAFLFCVFLCVLRAGFHPCRPWAAFFCVFLCVLWFQSSIPTRIELIERIGRIDSLDSFDSLDNLDQSSIINHSDHWPLPADH